MTAGYRASHSGEKQMGQSRLSPIPRFQEVSALRVWLPDWALALNLSIRRRIPRLSKYHHNVPIITTQIAATVPCFQAKAYAIAETGISTNMIPTQTIPRYCRLGITCPTMLTRQAHR